jgi:hypothetical protein
MRNNIGVSNSFGDFNAFDMNIIRSINALPNLAQSSLFVFTSYRQMSILDHIHGEDAYSSTFQDFN